MEDNSLSSRPMTEEEIKKALNIPPRDIESYPEYSEDVKTKGGSFMYKLSLLASGADGNLQSLVWELYDRLDDYIHLNDDSASIKIAETLVSLRDYIQENKNIIFADINNK